MFIDNGSKSEISHAEKLWIMHLDCLSTEALIVLIMFQHILRRFAKFITRMFRLHFVDGLQ